eukprot:CAMPEP_0174284830 /NCGR_PEP_ID=MMETSP0809-20121228/6845_1 /TAXON_ID=73025 ORGANISM="Eutreptiella gymnastica-like, Strain CCMP1594" /NCGR_SAMPLE_ID=MMETSP0809 /ASSEMBLY_ACC=CAM_ASM_000658 /LENGTH=406 /DNA_ID=CAMNT_0015380473 /DNA_START=15 /DNA_END=1235 /DNA_ORIENTATION=+
MSKLSLSAAIIWLVVLLPAVHACSRILWTKYSNSFVMSGRSMDWVFSFDDYLYVVPRGIPMDGGMGKGSARWTSKYGSVVSSMSGWSSKHGFDFVRDGGTDGINEKGLAVHVLLLEATEYPPPDKDIPGVSYLRWARYLLDNFATVAEAVEGTKKVHILSVAIMGHVLGAHVAIEDSNGDSAIFEIIEGKLHVYHDKKAVVMTNDPPYDQQLKLLRRYEGFGGDLPLPGSTSSEDRFVRLSYYLPYLPKPADDTEAVASVQSLMMNAAVPFGAPYGDDVYPTWWTSYSDLTNGVYYFNWVKNPFLIWVELKNLDFSAAEVLVLNPRDPRLLGEVSALFTEVGTREAQKAAVPEMHSTTLSVFGCVSAIFVCSIFAVAIHQMLVKRTAGGGRMRTSHLNPEESPLLT